MHVLWVDLAAQTPTLTLPLTLTPNPTPTPTPTPTLTRYRLGWDYPLHLGVTEAGEGEDGRMKSAIGIGKQSVVGSK